jgi:hypothetical protein
MNTWEAMLQQELHEPLVKDESSSIKLQDALSPKQFIL